MNSNVPTAIFPIVSELRSASGAFQFG